MLIHRVLFVDQLVLPNTTIDRKSTRLNSSHTVIYTLSLHDALPILVSNRNADAMISPYSFFNVDPSSPICGSTCITKYDDRSEEHTSELQSHSDLHSFPTRRSSDLGFKP